MHVIVNMKSSILFIYDTLRTQYSYIVIWLKSVDCRQCIQVYSDVISLVENIVLKNYQDRMVYTYNMTIMPCSIWIFSDENEVIMRALLIFVDSILYYNVETTYYICLFNIWVLLKTFEIDSILSMDVIVKQTLVCPNEYQWLESSKSSKFDLENTAR